MEFKQLESLLNYYEELDYLDKAQSLISWDTQTHVPLKGQQYRAQMSSYLAEIAHTKKTDSKYLDLIEQAQAALPEFAGHQKFFEYQKSISLCLRDAEAARRLPGKWVSAFSMAQNQSLMAWQEARQEKKFSILAPKLTKLVELVREKTSYNPKGNCDYDSLLDDFEPDTTCAMIDPLFEACVKPIQELIDQRKSCSIPSQYNQPCKFAPLEEFSRDLAHKIGLDENGFRMDQTIHPFMSNIGTGDIRIAVREKEHNALSIVASIMHEGGHGLYEQHLNAIFHKPHPIAQAASFGIHESQSRLMEVWVGNNPNFWEIFFPQLAQAMGWDYDSKTPLEIARYLNRIEPGMIRVEADIFCYNLHIFLRYQIEKDLIAGKLSVKDLADRWNQDMQKFLGLLPQNDLEGVLQDIHWPHGLFGYFPCYALGNIYSAQIWNSFKNDNPSFWQDIKELGNFSTLKSWLYKNVHSHGRLYDVATLIKKASGEQIDSRFFIQQLNDISKNLQT